MRIAFIVNSAVVTDVMAEVDYQGEKIEARLPMLTVELVSDDPHQTNPTFHVPVDQRNKFVPGARVVAVFFDEGDDSK